MHNKNNSKFLKIRIKKLEENNRSLEEEIQTLRKEKLFTNSVLDSLPGIFYMYSEDGHIIRWNKNHELLTGFTYDEIA